MNKVFAVFFVILFLQLFGACASSEKFALLQNVGTNSEEKTADFQAILQPDDLLMIIISTDNPVISQPYNLANVSISANNEMASGQQRLLSYQIDQEGNIQMPNLETAQEVKKYVKSVFGATSPEYAQISGLKFTIKKD